MTEIRRTEPVVRRTLEICNSQGLHVRPASVLAELARRFRADIKVTAAGETVDGRSIMGLMTLGLPQGATIEIACDGEDEAQAAEEIAGLISRGFDEQ